MVRNEFGEFVNLGMVLGYPTLMLQRRRSLYFHAKIGLRSDGVPVCGRAAEVGGGGDHDGVVGTEVHRRCKKADS